MNNYVAIGNELFLEVEEELTWVAVFKFEEDCTLAAEELNSCTRELVEQNA